MFNIKLAGEHAIIIYFGDQIAPELVEKISFYSQQLTDGLADLIIDIVPSYTSLMVSYKLDFVGYEDFRKQVEDILVTKSFVSGLIHSKLIEIPVYYGLDVGLDLAQLLIDKDLHLEQFIDIHSATDYLVYAIGFSPVFAFLGELDPRLHSARLITPRIRIPAGSVGIADNQTAVYPVASSGGWNIIGKTPIDLSINNNENIKRFSVGDKVKFVPISQQEFLLLGGLL